MGRSYRTPVSQLGENPGLKSETWATHSMRWFARCCGSLVAVVRSLLWFARCCGSLVAVTVVLEEALHKRKTEPLSELLARFRQSSDRHESKRLMESNGGHIDPANTGNDAVTAPRLTK
jgi:hypothetical protein